jgi:signal transduction histidine kinase
MNRSTDFTSKWIFYLAGGCFYAGVILRSTLTPEIRPNLGLMLTLVMIGLVLSAIEPILTPRWKAYFPIYLVCQVVLIVALLTREHSSDLYANLFFIPSMLIMLRLCAKIGWLWIAFCAPLITIVLWPANGGEAIALALVYTAGNAFFGSYALTTRRAQAARLQNQALAGELQVANQQLMDYSSQLGQLAVERERNQWARELHDSVTQTVFSMMLATQSASLLFERDPPQAEVQLERLSQLGDSALSEMQTLISELSPEKEPRGGLVPALRRHVEERRLQDGLTVSLKVEGDQPLTAAEEQCLFRIAQEALNNILKHAQTWQAQIFIHLGEPFWMEVTDQGKGFDLGQVDRQGKVGLHSMRERAAQIGWELGIITSPGTGTCIRVEKAPIRER